MAKQARTHAVRCRVREVVYKAFVEDLVGNAALAIKSGYGPGMPNIEPGAVLGPDADVESEEFKKAADDYRKGQLIYILDVDYSRLKNSGAVMDEEDVEELIELEEEELDVESASVEDLTRWIQEEGPNVQDVVDASEGEAAYATKLLEAESKAHEGDPRKGVLEGLSAVISRG